MRAITARIRRLQAALAPHEDPRSQRLAGELRERRRRRMETEGVRYEEPPSLPPPAGSVKYLSLAESLRRGRELAYKRNRASALAQAETATDIT